MGGVAADLDEPQEIREQRARRGGGELKQQGRPCAAFGAVGGRVLLGERQRDLGDAEELRLERARVGGAAQATAVAIRSRSAVRWAAASGTSSMAPRMLASNGVGQRAASSRSSATSLGHAAASSAYARACSASPARSSAGSSCSALAWPSPTPARRTRPPPARCRWRRARRALLDEREDLVELWPRGGAAVAASSSSSPSSAPARLSSAAPRSRSAATRSSDRQRKAALPASRCDFISWIAWRATGSRVAACGSSARSSSAGETPAPRRRR